MLIQKKQLDEEISNKFFQKTLNNRYPWAEETIKDFIHTISLEEFLDRQGSYDILLHKMIFGEYYSLFDRLNINACQVISNIYKSKELERYNSEEYEEYIKHSKDVIKSNPNYSYILFKKNDLLNKSKPYYFKKIQFKDGDLKIEIEGIDKPLQTKDNWLFDHVASIRNKFQHSWQTEFKEFYFSNNFYFNIKVKEENDLDEFRREVTTWWRKESWLLKMMFIYSLEYWKKEIDEKKEIVSNE